MLSWGVYLLLKGRIESTFYLLVLVGAASAAYAEAAAKLARAPATIFLIPALIPLVPGSYVYYMMSALVLNKLSTMRHYGQLTAEWAFGLAAGIGLIAAPDRELEAARKALTLLYRLYRSNARVACAAAMTAAGENIEKAKRLRRGEDEHDGACGGDAHGGVFSTAVCRGRADPGEAVFRLRAEGSV